MKKLMFICVSLFMMVGFLPAKVQAPNTEMACIWTSCTGTICDQAFQDVEFAALVIDVIEDYVCN